MNRRFKYGMALLSIMGLLSGCADLNYPPKMSGPHTFQMAFTASPEVVQSAVTALLEEEDFTVQVHDPQRRLIAWEGVGEDSYLLIQLVPIKTDLNGRPRTLLGIRHLNKVRPGVFGLKTQVPYPIPAAVRKDLPDRLLEKMHPVQ